jgi:hypothetical protein
MDIRKRLGSRARPLYYIIIASIWHSKGAFHVKREFLTFAYHGFAVPIA